MATGTPWLATAVASACMGSRTLPAVITVAFSTSSVPMALSLRYARKGENAACAAASVGSGGAASPSIAKRCSERSMAAPPFATPAVVM